MHRWLETCHEAASEAYRYLHEISTRQQWTAAIKRAPMPLTIADSIILGGKVRRGRRPRRRCRPRHRPTCRRPRYRPAAALRYPV